MKLRSHLRAISDLQHNLQDIIDTAGTLSDSTLKGRLLASAETMQITADCYTDQTIGLYEDILSFAMGAAL